MKGVGGGEGELQLLGLVVTEVAGALTGASLIWFAGNWEVACVSRGVLQLCHESSIG